MESRVQEAMRKKTSGYNCAQSIACTYCDLADMDEETMRNVTNAFASGMGTMDGTCGAITGAATVLGLMHKNQPAAIKDMRQVIGGFKAQNGTVVCSELKGIGTGEVIRTCPECVGDAARLLEEAVGFESK